MQALAYLTIGFRDILVSNWAKVVLMWYYGINGIMAYYFEVFAFLLLLKHGFVEINPGLKKKETIFFCFYWNVNGIVAHNNFSLLEYCYTIHQYDILCKSETCLEFSVYSFCSRLYFCSILSPLRCSNRLCLLVFFKNHLNI